jgi:hypothetical protein
MNVMSLLQHYSIQPKKKHLSSITLGWMYNRKGGQKGKDFKCTRVLLDSGCGGTLVNRSFVRKYQKTTLSKSTNWTTKAGTFKTDRTKVKCQFTFPEFCEGKDISWNMYVDESDARLNIYDMIIGRDLLHELGIHLLFSLGIMKWDNATVPMRDPSQLRDSNLDDIEDEIFSIHDPTTTDAARIQEIMDVKYAPADINGMVSKCDHLTNTERSDLKMLLSKFESLFDGTLVGTWDTDPIDLELKDAQPYHARPYPVPQSRRRPNSKLKLSDWFLTVCCKESTALNGNHQCVWSQRKIKPSDPLQS